MIAEALTANIVARHAPRLRRDAARLLSAALWVDAPEGIAVLPEPRPGVIGSCIGSGVLVAQAAGCRPGMIAVRVNVEKILGAWVDGEHDDIDAALDGAAIDVEAVAAHEAAHALAAAPDRVLADDAARAWVAASRYQEAAAETACSHHARWAALTLAVAARCAARRPAWTRSLWRSWAARDVESYGHDAQAIAEAAGELPDDARLRDVFAPDGEHARRVEAVAAPMEARIAAVVRRLAG